MNKKFSIRLNTSAEQLQRLRSLQANFVEVCNAIASVVQETRCWNRVALHHLVYHKMREQFPQTGSQMICNAIYSVSLACRKILQHPQIASNKGRNGDLILPKFIFSQNSPVFFDRHTLNLTGRKLSMYTLDGRIHFALTLSEKQQQMFHEEKLKEILLIGDAEGFSLHFYFDHEAAQVSQGAVAEADFPDNRRVIPGNGDGLIDQTMVLVS